MINQVMNKANLHLTVCLMEGEDDPPKAKKGKVLGELISASVSFSLNSIPSASISVPLGAALTSRGTVEPSYAYSSSVVSLVGAFYFRKLVGVYVESEGGEVCLFKGYVVHASTTLGVGSGALTLTLAHWLSNLGIFPMLHRLSSPENTTDLSQEAVFRAKLTGQSGISANLSEYFWTPSMAGVQATHAKKDIWEAIKAFFNAALSESQELKQEDPGYTSKELFELESKCLNAIESKHLKLNSKFQEADYLTYSIASAIKTQSSNNYYATTIWDKMTQTLLPTFYCDLIPLVSSAYVVPKAGLHMTRDRMRVISMEEISNMHTNAKYRNLLGGVFIASKNAITVNTEIATTTQKSTSICYPKKFNAGVLKACRLPLWLECSSGMTGALRSNTYPRFKFTGDKAEAEAKEKNAEVQKKAKDNVSIAQELAEAFVKSVYVTEATRDNLAFIQIPLRYDIVPGDSVAIEIPRDDLSAGSLKQEYIYGVATAVECTISGSQVHTLIHLFNVRNDAMLDRLDLSGDALLYDKGWRDKDDDTMLYS